MVLQEQAHAQPGGVNDIAWPDGVCYKNRTIEVRGIPRSEGVAEPEGDFLQRRRGRISRQRPVGDAVQDADVVDAGDMVRVSMGEQYSVHPGDATVQQLAPHLR